MEERPAPVVGILGWMAGCSTIYKIVVVDVVVVVVVLVFRVGGIMKEGREPYLMIIIGNVLPGNTESKVKHQAKPQGQ